MQAHLLLDSRGVCVCVSVCVSLMDAECPVVMQAHLLLDSRGVCVSFMDEECPLCACVLFMEADCPVCARVCVLHGCSVLCVCPYGCSDLW